MADHVTPNLPSRDFDVTEAFYAKLGFATSWKDRGWMILQRGGLQLEFQAEAANAASICSENNLVAPGQ